MVWGGLAAPLMIHTSGVGRVWERRNPYAPRIAREMGGVPPVSGGPSHTPILQVTPRPVYGKMSQNVSV
jgi:hypothetical protein